MRKEKAFYLRMFTRDINIRKSMISLKYTTFIRVVRWACTDKKNNSKLRQKFCFALFFVLTFDELFLKLFFAQ